MDEPHSESSKSTQKVLGKRFTQLRRTSCCITAFTATFGFASRASERSAGPAWAFGRDSFLVGIVENGLLAAGRKMGQCRWCLVRQTLPHECSMVLMFEGYFYYFYY